MKSENTENNATTTEKAQEKKTMQAPIKHTELPVCGVVMPIAPMGDYSKNHWADVLNIIKEAAEIAGYKAQLVSDSESVGVIHRDIVQNLYQNEIIVCDVSGKNPNVMFELGMRLTFDKPTVIIKDDVTNYSFDIGNIRHLEYPHDLRYNVIQGFRKDLANRIREAIKAYDDPNYTTFLKHFKDLQIKPAELESKEVSLNEVVLVELKNINSRLSRIENKNNLSKNMGGSIILRPLTLQLNNGITIGLNLKDIIVRFSDNLKKNDSISNYMDLLPEEKYALFFSFLAKINPSFNDIDSNSNETLKIRFYDAENEITRNIWGGGGFVGNPTT